MGVETAAWDCRVYEPFTFKCRGHRNSNEPARRHIFFFINDVNFNRLISV